MEIVDLKLRGPAVFVLAFLLVSLLSYVPLIACLTVHIGKIVIAAGVGTVLTVVLHRYFDRYHKTVDPRGRAVFITGCDTGFGDIWEKDVQRTVYAGVDHFWHELAHRLHKFGFHIFAGCISVNSPGAETLRAIGTAEDGRMDIVPVDVTDTYQVLECAARIKDELRAKRLELYALVNIAGVSIFCEFEWIPMEDYEKMMSINALGSVRIMKAFLPMLRDSGGRIVIVASLAGRYAMPGMVGYSMSKHAQVALADGLRRELKKFGIRVSLVEPGMYKTAMADLPVGLSVLEKYWSSLPEDTRTFYGDAYYGAARRHMEKISNSASARVSEPVDCMEDAVVSQNPKVRYAPCGTFAGRIRGFVFPFLPYSLQDYIMEKVSIPAQPLCRNTFDR